MFLELTRMAQPKVILLLAFALASDASVLSPAAESLALDDECGSEGCANYALQLRATLGQRASRANEELARESQGCHDVTEADGPSECLRAINWARHEGLATHPEWYTGLTINSSMNEWQFVSYNITHSKCPRPCSIPESVPWCQGKEAPELWTPAAAGDAVQVKILSYNLFWWHLFGVEHGRGGSAGRVIRDSMRDQAFDVMGFQECEDPKKVLEPPGLLGEYEAIQGDHAICMAYRTAVWSLLEKGEDDVAEDMRTEFYGKRGTQWMRLQHKDTGRTLFFMNHHGPLSVNSGGLCGGQATAHNLLDVMAKRAQVGDALVLVGDFNANAASRTLQYLWPHLTQVYNSKSFGGVDNIFSNVRADSVVTTHDLGSGGSDHHAIAAVIQVGPDSPKPSTTIETTVAAQSTTIPVASTTSSAAAAADTTAATSGEEAPVVETGGGTNASSASEATTSPAVADADTTAATSGEEAPVVKTGGETNASSASEASIAATAATAGSEEAPAVQASGGSIASSASEGAIAAAAACGKLFEQCGGLVNGKAFLGPSCCESGLKCLAKNEWYSQCKEDSAEENLGAENLGAEGPAVKEPSFSVTALEHTRGSAGCLLEPQTEYLVEGGWSEHHSQVTDPRVCCDICNDKSGCTAWVWTDWNSESHGARCTLHGGKPTGAKTKDGYVSGLPHAAAVAEATSAALRASK